MNQKENKNINEQSGDLNNFINKKRRNQKEEEDSNRKKYKKQKKEAKNEKFSKELENLIEYKYNDKGELVHKKAGTKCERLSKQEYEIVGMYVQKYVENLLIKTFNLTTLYIPNNMSSDFTKRDESQAQCKILTTKDFPKNPKCLMLIQGTGAVRLGQWARSVCINENIDLGSMKPYIEKAIQNKFSVIILNPNERKDLTYENGYYYMIKNGDFYRIDSKYSSFEKLFHFPSISTYQVHNDMVLFVVDNTLYFYSDSIGIKKILEYDELRYNYENICDFYQS